MLFHQHFHLRSARAFRVGRPLLSFIGPFTPDIRAQKERLRGPPPGCGALRLDPVALLYLRRPFAVRPPVRDLCSPILRLTERVLLFVTTFLTSLAGAFTFVCHHIIPRRRRSAAKSLASILSLLPAMPAIFFCLDDSFFIFFFFAGGRPTFDPYVPGP